MSLLPTMLGMRSGMRISILNPPAGFAEKLEPLPDGLALMDKSSTGLDLILFFTAKKLELIEKLPALARGMAITGHIWVCFPANAENAQAPSEEFVRLAALEMGLHDDKRLALDPEWTALRLSWKPRAPRLEKPQIQA
jgi:hypothetical protein